MAITTMGFRLTLPNNQALSRPEVEQAVAEQMAAPGSVCAFEVTVEPVGCQSDETVVRASERIQVVMPAVSGVIESLLICEVYEEASVRKGDKRRLHSSPLLMTQTNPLQQ